MVRVECPESVNGYFLKIRFKQWGKLWAPGNLSLRTLQSAESIERRDYRFGTVLHQLPLPKSIKNLIVGKRYGIKKRLSRRTSRTSEVPTSLVLECYNPAETTVALSLTVRSAGKNDNIPFQKLVSLVPGSNLIKIPFVDIASVVNLSFPFNIEILPNDIDEEMTLYFGLMEFIQELQQDVIKCVVWDLDNTLWDGVLAEDGIAGLRLKPNIINIMEALDRHGILQSLASKNDYDHAMQALKHFNIGHFFLYPQISWFPKGDAINAIARQLNIGVKTLLFIDDSTFERQQVRSSCPEIHVMDAKDYLLLTSIVIDNQAPVTEESRGRRKLYKVEKDRNEFALAFRDDYRSFLKQCDIKLTIDSLNAQNLERVHELTQRTNQMNFSGNRYDRNSLWKILESPHLESYVLTCTDKFGSYGIVGFGIVDSRKPLLTDLMFSCRIQSKRIEHAFLSHIMKEYLSRDNKGFYANYRKTPRNEPSGRVFADLTMEDLGVVDGVTSLFFPADREVPHDGIIEILAQDQYSSVSVRT
ncbi:HAD-IIIC family phosphatase [Granulicella sp. dw_53]|uniref:HAD-IIIC family phosphatase n=1 Tax=Granulicella sp. dw_53 TaxID=2719792 RepID=UPI001BD22B61|nr:HAD-IIIC family phosphatase [Granulicella sp. dw_53]